MPVSRLAGLRQDPGTPRRVKLHCFKQRQRNAPRRSHNCLATAKALSTAAFHFGHGSDIAIGACADHDVVLLSPAMAEPHFKGAVGAHDGSDVVLYFGKDARPQLTLNSS